MKAALVMKDVYALCSHNETNTMKINNINKWHSNQTEGGCKFTD